MRKRTLAEGKVEGVQGVVTSCQIVSNCSLAEVPKVCIMIVTIVDIIHISDSVVLVIDDKSINLHVGI